MQRSISCMILTKVSLGYFLSILASRGPTCPGRALEGYPDGTDDIDGFENRHCRYKDSHSGGKIGLRFQRRIWMCIFSIFQRKIKFLKDFCGLKIKWFINFYWKTGITRVQSAEPVKWKFPVLNKNRVYLADNPVYSRKIFKSFIIWPH